MPCLQRAVLLRAAAALLVLGAAVGADHTVVGEALAKRGAERAEREAYVCAVQARADAVARAARYRPPGRQSLDDPGRPHSCGSNGR
ncbi:hypothetical protein ACFVHB_11675 [Kitasatospora sp. NPDC127111]|uniref:hypothetical protein n=1 Tax=Kitasatospora sp. NPDC127111 TaxID=3345363 RepID=UPI0036419482